MKIAVVYIYPLGGRDKHFMEAFRFMDSYHSYPPGMDHETVIVCNGQPCGEEDRLLFGTLPNCRFFDHDDTGFDIGGYIAASKTVEADLMLCLGGSAYFHRSGWLCRLADAWQRHGPGFYGTSATYRASPHINTSGFACPPKLLESYPFAAVTKQDRYNFEHGAAEHCDIPIEYPQDKSCRKRAIWRIAVLSGMPALLVTWDGEYQWWDWRKPRNIYHSGDQSNQLIWWHLTDLYFNADFGTQRELTRVADLLADPDFNRRTRTFK